MGEDFTLLPSPIFAMEVVQCIVFQIVAVNVKVKAGFVFTLKQLIYSLLWANVKGEAK